MKAYKLLALAALLLSFVAAPALANDVYVDSNWGGPYYGTQANPDRYIQTAIGRISGTGTVKVRRNTTYTQTITLPQGVVIEGGYDSNWSLPSPPTLPDRTTTIHGNGYSVVHVESGDDFSTALKNLTITDGIGTDVDQDTTTYGGGVYAEGYIIIDNCSINSNSATYGAGVYTGPDVYSNITRSEIIGNCGYPGETETPACYGVGVYCFWAILQDNDISYNYVLDECVCYGIGVYLAGGSSLDGNDIEYNYHDSPDFSDCGMGVYADLYGYSDIQYNHIRYNGSSGYGYGGGIYVTSSYIGGNTISGNESWGGGGIYSLSEGLIEFNTISDNSAPCGAGIYTYATGWIGGNKIIDNHCDGEYGWGSAIYGYSCDISSNLIHGNTGADSAVYLGGPGPNESFSNNTVDSNSGYGIRLNYPSSGTEVCNNIFSRSTYGIYSDDSYSTYNNCFANVTTRFAGTSPSSTNDMVISQNPLLIFKDLESDDFHLASDSPCIDEGNDSKVGSEWTDIDGEPRQVDIPNVGTTGTKVDIGADEYYPNYTTSPMVDRSLPSSTSGTVNEDAGANRCNFRWADASSFDIGYGDSFQFYPGPSWVIDEVAVWIVPDVPVLPSYYLSDYYDDVTLYLSNGQTGALTAAKSASFSGSGTTDQYVQVSTTDYGSSTNYQCSDGTSNQIWKIEFSNLNATITADSTVYFGVIGTPRVDRLWFNHATHGLADGTIRKFDITDLSSTTAVSGVGWFGKDADINVQVFAHPQ